MKKSSKFSFLKVSSAILLSLLAIFIFLQCVAALKEEPPPNTSDATIRIQADEPGCRGRNNQCNNNGNNKNNDWNNGDGSGRGGNGNGRGGDGRDRRNSDGGDSRPRPPQREVTPQPEAPAETSSPAPINTPAVEPAAPTTAPIASPVPVLPPTAASQLSCAFGFLPSWVTGPYAKRGTNLQCSIQCRNSGGQTQCNPSGSDFALPQGSVVIPSNTGDGSVLNFYAVMPTSGDTTSVAVSQAGTQILNSPLSVLLTGGPITSLNTTLACPAAIQSPYLPRNYAFDCVLDCREAAGKTLCSSSSVVVQPSASVTNIANPLRITPSLYDYETLVISVKTPETGDSMPLKVSLSPSLSTYNPAAVSNDLAGSPLIIPLIGMTPIAAYSQVFCQQTLMQRGGYTSPCLIQCGDAGGGALCNSSSVIVSPVVGAILSPLVQIGANNMTFNLTTPSLGDYTGVSVQMTENGKQVDIQYSPFYIELVGGPASDKSILSCVSEFAIKSQQIPCAIMCLDANNQSTSCQNSDFSWKFETLGSTTPVSLPNSALTRNIRSRAELQGQVQRSVNASSNAPAAGDALKISTFLIDKSNGASVPITNNQVELTLVESYMGMTPTASNSSVLCANFLLQRGGFVTQCLIECRDTLGSAFCNSSSVTMNPVAGAVLTPLIQAGASKLVFNLSTPFAGDFTGVSVQMYENSKLVDIQLSPFYIELTGYVVSNRSILQCDGNFAVRSGPIPCGVMCLDYTNQTTSCADNDFLWKLEAFNPGLGGNNSVTPPSPSMPIGPSSSNETTAKFISRAQASQTQRSVNASINAPANGDAIRVFAFLITDKSTGASIPVTNNPAELYLIGNQPTLASLLECNSQTGMRGESMRCSIRCKDPNGATLCTVADFLFPREAAFISAVKASTVTAAAAAQTLAISFIYPLSRTPEPTEKIPIYLKKVNTTDQLEGQIVGSPWVVALSGPSALPQEDTSFISNSQLGPLLYGIIGGVVGIAVLVFIRRWYKNRKARQQEECDTVTAL